MDRRFFLAAAGSLLAAPAFAQGVKLPAGTDPENTLVLELKDGAVIIKLRPDLAPKHVERIKTLTRQGFYNGIVFHRVMEGFMAQTGDPTGTGTGGSTLPNVAAEFNSLSFTRGVLGAARTSDPNTFNSQFFICFAPATFLDRQYTAFGQVVSGMEFVDRIKRGQGGSGMVPAPQDKIVRLRVAADIK